jgi:bacterioferritin (cytochrome b1)
MVKIICLLLMVCFFFVPSIHPQKELTNCNKYKTWISMVKEEGMLKIAGNFENNTSDELNISYIMISKKSGKGGSSVTTQKGTIAAGSFKSSVLSTSNINLEKNNVYSLVLTTIKNDEVIGRDSVLYSQN